MSRAQRDDSGGARYWRAIRRELFQANLVDAAVDAKKSLRLVMNHGQRGDHPVLLALPETEYLKGITAELMAGR